jgi:hypothetical protein
MVLQRFDRVRRFSPAAMSMTSGPKEAPANNPGLHTEIDPATKGYFMQQTVHFIPRLFHPVVNQACQCAIEFKFSILGLDPSV